MWGEKPWENDIAADWFGNTMEKTDLPSRVRETLKMYKLEDPNGDNTTILRAAVFCMLQFGRVYIWPIRDLDDDLQLGIKACKKTLKNKDYCHSKKLVQEIKDEMAVLSSRLDS